LAGFPARFFGFRSLAAGIETYRARVANKNVFSGGNIHTGDRRHISRRDAAGAGGRHVTLVDTRRPGNSHA